MKITNSYHQLGESFYDRCQPHGYKNPSCFLWNTDLANQLMIPNELSTDDELKAAVFSGSRIWNGFDPIALAYAGHQFGHFVPQLGDGRAHLLGEVLDADGIKKEIQLKGSGRTGFSRGGDGRCGLGPAIREFVMSEAMHALRIPTTRSLAVVLTGEPVFRQRAVAGAIVTRVASSHIRVGTFEYFAAQKNNEALKKLQDYTIKRHFPHLLETAGNPSVLLLEAVMQKQVQLVVEWMRVGFIHGVMNTDNTALSGETIDYGPCAMMGRYHPQTVYSSIDSHGRYAFGNQPRIIHWNLTRLAESLLPIVHEDQSKAISALEKVILEFPNIFEQAHLKMLAGKIGITSSNSKDQVLFDALLERMHKREMDYTVTFHLLTQSLTSSPIHETLKSDLGDWLVPWHQRLKDQNKPIEQIAQEMRFQNPVVIPRNHHMEAVIRACEETQNPQTAEAFLHVLRSPYRELQETSVYQDPPEDGDLGYQTFCGT